MSGLGLYSFSSRRSWGADAKSKNETVQGYVLDSACAFTKGLDKPISRECATACAKAGSPLVILAANGTIYWPIADTTPSSGQKTSCFPSPVRESRPAERCSSVAGRARL